MHLVHRRALLAYHGRSAAPTQPQYQGVGECALGRVFMASLRARMRGGPSAVSDLLPETLQYSHTHILAKLHSRRSTLKRKLPKKA